MPPDHDHFSGRVIQVGLRRMPDRETGAQADWIVCQLRRFPFALYHRAEQARGTR
jgi:hypothetical protein